MIPAVVFDCMVFVQALGNAKGPACACYELVRAGRLTLYVSRETISELGDVLSRPKVRRKLPALTDESVEAFLRNVLGRATMLSVAPEVRPKVRRKLPALTDESVEAFLRNVLGRATMLSVVPEVFRLERDPKDERYINLAIASGATYLVTWDRDLLDLMGDEGFRHRFPHLTILEPPALLRLLPQDPAGTATE
jgi:predicted nucleic acid-binding protein